MPAIPIFLAGKTPPTAGKKEYVGKKKDAVS